MEVVGITIKQLEVTFTLTETEIDMLSIALSNTTIAASTQQERAAADVLKKFATFLNTMQDKVDTANANASSAH